MKYSLTLVAVSLAMVLPAAAGQQNAVPSTPKSIADGGSAYNRSCASCHGKSGTGDGPASKQLNPKPSNLVDAEWTHGTSDSEIFAVIRSGVPKTAMKGFASKMTERETWDIINYLRSVGPAPVK
ncbi:MAG: c-type cytochrome [Vicinamibacterales bacterium]|nr:c-type cytochrome [Vicinamibacterales bacterium]